MLIYSLLAGVVFIGYVCFSTRTPETVAFLSGYCRFIRSYRRDVGTELLGEGASFSFPEYGGFCRKSVASGIPYRLFGGAG